MKEDIKNTMIEPIAPVRAQNTCLISRWNARVKIGSNSPFDMQLLELFSLNTFRKMSCNVLIHRIYIQI